MMHIYQEMARELFRTDWSIDDYAWGYLTRHLAEMYMYQCEMSYLNSWDA